MCGKLHLAYDIAFINFAVHTAKFLITALYERGTTHMKDNVIILDFAGGHNQLIARKVREQRVFCEILPYTKSFDAIMAKQPKGIILIGGNEIDANGAAAPQCDPKIFTAGIPVLGIGYGALVLAKVFGGELSPYAQSADKMQPIMPDVQSPLFVGVGNGQVLAHVAQSVTALPGGFVKIADMAFADETNHRYGLLFHPEADETKIGEQVLHNFLYDICGVNGGWTMQAFADDAIADIRKTVGEGKVLLALSGGVDSSVVAVLLHKAIGKNLICIFVDTGLMRKDEGDDVERIFGSEFDINLKRVNAEERFLGKLAGVEDPEQKRKIIGEEFIRVFEEEAKKVGHVEYLAQGTIYPDIIESGVGAALVKSHHNVGGLPEHIDFDGLIEPVRDLFKDEVRALGEVLGIPAHMVWRQPFPGPGLGIRVIGELTKQKLDVLREVDAIFREEVANVGLDREIWQYFAVLTGIRSVGVSSDSRTYKYMVALRAVNSIDAMTADFARVPYDVLAKASSRIVAEVPEVNRVVYDITAKPPATIEWE